MAFVIDTQASLYMFWIRWSQTFHGLMIFVVCCTLMQPCWLSKVILVKNTYFSYFDG
jgi:hypothetical protein